MKVCEKCNREFVDDRLDFCPDDGAKLYSVVVADTGMVGRVLDGRFEVLEMVGQGGMGQVFRAHQLSMNREIALKVLPLEMASDKEAVRRFLKEAQAVSRINHPNAITVYDFGQTEDGVLYLAMEYIRGRSLSDLIAARGSVSVANSCDIVIQICNALEEAHTLGIVHRDLKPDNIMVVEKAGHDLFIKVLDFGLAKIRFGDSTLNQTKTGLICGTPHYMSPEQVMGERVDERADIYATGIILYELCTGHPPFDADSPMAIAMKHLKNDPPPIRTNAARVVVPLDLQVLILKCLAKKREDRPSSARELRDALKRIMRTTHHAQSVELPAIRTGISQVMDSDALAAEKRPTVEALETMSFEDVHGELADGAASSRAVGGDAMVKGQAESPVDDDWPIASPGASALRSWKLWVPASLLLAAIVVLIVAPWKKGRSDHDVPKTKPQTVSKLERLGASNAPPTTVDPKTLGPKTGPTLGPRSDVTTPLPGTTIGTPTKNGTPTNGTPTPTKNGTPTPTPTPTKNGTPPTNGTPTPTKNGTPPTNGTPTPTNPNPSGPRKVPTPVEPKPNPNQKLEVKTPKIVELRLETVPPGATIYVDGKKRGRAPLTVSRPFDKQRTIAVKIAKRGYESRSFDVPLVRSGVFSYALVRAKARTKKKKKKKNGTGDRIFSP
ncbi:MAG: serine/threonine protein kinase [Myxococcales bacterium]|nr:serine/threonine protein kinase [Myxococcales bacterium]